MEKCFFETLKYYGPVVLDLSSFLPFQLIGLTPKTPNFRQYFCYITDTLYLRYHRSALIEEISSKNEEIYLRLRNAVTQVFHLTLSIDRSRCIAKKREKKFDRALIFIRRHMLVPVSIVVSTKIL